MPKTNEKDAYYFPHDCNARNDPKVLALRSVFGAEGYGVYFMLVEILREQPDYKLSVTKYIWSTLAMQMQVHAEKVQKIVEACRDEFGLLTEEDGKLFSPSLLRRMEKTETVSATRSMAARKRWESQKNPSNQPCKDEGTPASDDPQDANAMQMQSKSKAIKENKIKPDQSRADKEQKKIDHFAAFAGDDMELLAALRSFEAMRKKIKKPLTDEAKRRMLIALEKLSSDRATQIAILNQSEDRCWLGLFPLREEPGLATSEDKAGALQDLYEGFGGVAP